MEEAAEKGDDQGPACPHCGGDATGARELRDGALVCPGCSRSFMPGQSVPLTGPRRRAPGASRSSAPAAQRDPDDLFSEGFFGLLEKGPLGWILFGLIGGFVWAAFQWLIAL